MLILNQYYSIDLSDYYSSILSFGVEKKKNQLKGRCILCTPQRRVPQEPNNPTAQSLARPILSCQWLNFKSVHFLELCHDLESQPWKDTQTQNWQLYRYSPGYQGQALGTPLITIARPYSVDPQRASQLHRINLMFEGGVLHPSPSQRLG